MKRPKFVTMKILAMLIGFCGTAAQSYAEHGSEHVPHQMQHGFVLAADDKFASHLVATGHHSRQVEITGQLLIDDQSEMEFYQERKLQNAGDSYFLLQAQSLDLPTLSAGQVLTGYIIESKVGAYEPKNKIVKSAAFQVEKVLLNIPNPFFAEEVLVNSISQPRRSQPKSRDFGAGLLNSLRNEKKHCCDTGEKPCNWKC